MGVFWRIVDKEKARKEKHIPSGDYDAGLLATLGFGATMKPIVYGAGGGLVGGLGGSGYNQVHGSTEVDPAYSGAATGAVLGALTNYRVGNTMNDLIKTKKYVHPLLTAYGAGLGGLTGYKVGKHFRSKDAPAVEASKTAAVKYLLTKKASRRY